jgi:hypothetical protein
VCCPRNQHDNADWWWSMGWNSYFYRFRLS